MKKKLPKLGHTKPTEYFKMKVMIMIKDDQNDGMGDDETVILMS